MDTYRALRATPTIAVSGYFFSITKGALLGTSLKFTQNGLRNLVGRSKVFKIRRLQL